MHWEYQKEKKKRNIWNNNDWEFAQINVRHQTTGISKNTKQDKYQKKLQLDVSYAENRTIRENPEVSKRKKNKNQKHLTYWGSA